MDCNVKSIGCMAGGATSKQASLNAGKQKRPRVVVDGIAQMESWNGEG